MTAFAIPLSRLPRLLDLRALVGYNDERVILLPLVDDLESKATALISVSKMTLAKEKPLVNVVLKFEPGMAVDGDVDRPLERRGQIDRVDSAGDRRQLVVLKVEGRLGVDVGHVQVCVAGTEYKLAELLYVDVDFQVPTE